MRHWGWWVLSRLALDRTGTRRTTKRSTRSIAVDEVKNLSGIIRVWTRLTHRPSDSSAHTAVMMEWIKLAVGVAGLRRSNAQNRKIPEALLLAALLGGCGPHAHIPLRPIELPGALTASDSGAALARSLAPVLYIQRDEKFPLSRVAAVVHPTRRIIAYHLLWRDDVNGSWIPFTVPTDEEVVWVGYDAALAPTDVWTYWHGTILHTPWPKTQVTIDVQWGKHGSLPGGIRESSLPKSKSLNFFYDAATVLFVPDQILGRITRKGEVFFTHSYKRYRDFSKVMPLSDKLDVVTMSEHPEAVLQAFFGKYSHKPNWPDTE
jgi:hypothetical protein